MNTANMLKVAEAIENSPEMYDQASMGVPKCGSAGCIAGWCLALGLGGKPLLIGAHAGNIQEAFEVSDIDARNIFYATWDWDCFGTATDTELSQPTADEAVQILRAFAAQGYVG